MPWLFKGKGDIQFEVYRNMRNDSGYEYLLSVVHNNVYTNGVIAYEIMQYLLDNKMILIVALYHIGGGGVL